ncbi:hypothetical protein TOC8172_14760 [Pseudomonas syringae]
MILRKLNLAPRSALCFGIFCLMIVALGVLALRQAALLNTAEKFIEENVLPSVKLLGSLDREFVGIRATTPACATRLSRRIARPKHSATFSSLAR